MRDGGRSSAPVDRLRFGYLGDDGQFLLEDDVSGLGDITVSLHHTFYRSGEAAAGVYAEAGVEGNVVEGFQYSHPWVQPGVIPRGTYGAGREGIEPPLPIGTVGVLSVLVCNDGLDAGLVEDLV